MFAGATGGPVIWLVCGGRDFQDTPYVFACLDRLVGELGRPEQVIVGGALGADTSAKMWAKHRKIRGWIVMPDWKKYGKAAGPLRNQRMLAYKPTHVIAFPGGAGTADMVRRASEARLIVLHHQPNPLPSPEDIHGACDGFGGSDF